MDGNSQVGLNGSSELLVATDGFVRILTLNRPEARNALTKSLLRSLSDALEQADASDDIRAIVITGAGDRAFCAGLDLKELNRDGQAGVALNIAVSGNRTVFQQIVEMQKPVIAAINGAAVAGGFELVLACDIRIANDQAKFGLPEATIGMGAQFASIVLPRRIPLCFAFEILFSGEYVSAQHAERIGLINRVVEQPDVLPVSLGIARRIAANAPLSVRRMKAMALRGLDVPLAEALHLDVGPNPYTSEDRLEGVRARLEKRPPVWRGR